MVEAALEVGAAWCRHSGPSARPCRRRRWRGPRNRAGPIPSSARRTRRRARSSSRHRRAGRSSRRCLLDQRHQALGLRVALIGEGDLGAVRRQRARDAPGDGMVVGDAHHQAALALPSVPPLSAMLSVSVSGHATEAVPCSRHVSGVVTLEHQRRRWCRRSRSCSTCARVDLGVVDALAHDGARRRRRDRVSSMLALSAMKPSCIIRSE